MKVTLTNQQLDAGTIVFFYSPETNSDYMKLESHNNPTFAIASDMWYEILSAESGDGFTTYVLGASAKTLKELGVPGDDAAYEDAQKDNYLVDDNTLSEILQEGDCEICEGPCVEDDEAIMDRLNDHSLVEDVANEHCVEEDDFDHYTTCQIASMRQTGVNNRIDGLINLKDKGTLKNAVKRIAQDLLEEGFDEQDIVTYFTREATEVIDLVIESQARDYVDRAELENGERL